MLMTVKFLSATQISPLSYKFLYTTAIYTSSYIQLLIKYFHLGIVKIPKLVCLKWNSLFYHLTPSSVVPSGFFISANSQLLNPKTCKSPQIPPSFPSNLSFFQTLPPKYILIYFSPSSPPLRYLKTLSSITQITGYLPAAHLQHPILSLLRARVNF